MAPPSIDLRDFAFGELGDFVTQLGLPRFRTEQLFKWIHGQRASSFAEMTNLSQELRQQLSQQAMIGQLRIDCEQVSRDGTRKLRLRTHDDRMIESVLIPDGDAGAPEPKDDEEEEDSGFETEATSENLFRGGRKPIPPSATHVLFPQHPKLTQCISSQVGCALDCTFCATAALGFGRNLSTSEIVDQVYRAQQLLAKLPTDDPTRRAGADRITNLVFMGMGEPLHNYQQVIRACQILTDSRGPNFSRRRITISTAGLVPALEKLAREPLQLNLAISLNATTDEVRDQIMPINRKWNIARLLEAVGKFPLERRRRVTFEYVLLDDVNDSEADANRLATLLRTIPAKVNLIPFNPHPLSTFRRPSDEKVRNFQSRLRENGLAVYVRRSRGDDIDAACGQLAAKSPTPLLALGGGLRKGQLLIG